MTVLRAIAGLVLLEVLSLGTPASADETIQVDLSNYAFTPSTLQLHVNSSYRLRLTNTSHSGHSFDAPQLFAAANVAPADQYKVAAGEIEVDAGQTVEVTFTPTRAGTYRFRCSHFLHTAFGMKGEAVVR